MSELRNIIGKNLSELRKRNGMTQLELAEKLNYSDKSISKWEHGDSLPSIENIVDICNFYHISLDDLIHEGIESKNNIDTVKQEKTNKIVVTCLSVLLVWLIATLIYVGIAIFFSIYYWLVFLWAFPISCVVLIVFNGVWGKTKYIYPITTFLVWSLLAAFYFQMLPSNLWLIFILGIPAELIIVFWSRIRTQHSQTKSKL
jgi:transcriptional regulator with XRE-family HTH domain